MFVHFRNIIKDHGTEKRVSVTCHKKTAMLVIPCLTPVDSAEACETLLHCNCIISEIKQFQIFSYFFLITIATIYNIEE